MIVAVAITILAAAGPCRRILAVRPLRFRDVVAASDARL